jgi:short-subunit dehydrogenase
VSKTALITGGSSGLGFEMARQLKAQGHNLILVARDKDKLESSAKVLASEPGSGFIKTIACDVSDENSIEACFKTGLEGTESIDFLIVNAGVTSIDLLSDYKELAAITRDLKINLLGAIASTYLCLPFLRSGSRILFVSSGFGVVGAPGYSLYCASKAGLNNFADAIRRELLPRNIHIHVACPGDIDTPMYAGELEVMPDWIREKMGRGKPAQVGYIAKYILKKCFKNKFMIVPSLDVKGLMLVQKILPRQLATRLIDNLLPRPPK